MLTSCEHLEENPLVGLTIGELAREVVVGASAVGSDDYFMVGMTLGIPELACYGMYL